MYQDGKQKSEQFLIEILRSNSIWHMINWNIKWKWRRIGEESRKKGTNNSWRKAENCIR